ncbi:MAG: hypothetical protein ACJ735_01590 [Actinomycetes bacterium]
MPHHVGPGPDPYFQELNKRFGGMPHDFLPAVREAITKLESTTPLEELARARVGPTAAQHLAEDWLSRGWPGQGAIEPKLRDGLLEGFKKSDATRLPMRFVPKPGERIFHVAVKVPEGADHVTVEISTL